MLLKLEPTYVEHVKKHICQSILIIMVFTSARKPAALLVSIVTLRGQKYDRDDSGIC